MRTMSPAEQQAFLDRDIDMTSAILRDLASNGVRLAVEPSVFAGLLRALVFVGMHREDIGPEIAPAVQDFLVESLARAIMTDDAAPDDGRAGDRHE